MYCVKYTYNVIFTVENSPKTFFIVVKLIYIDNTRKYLQVRSVEIPAKT